MDDYLASSEFIDWQTPAVLQLAKDLARGLNDDEAIAKACFEFVRDEIKHSWDHNLNPVTCKASDVLKFGTGYCYAKSHLLAALLRANAIPAGLCYQRLTIDDEKPPFCLHGLNAVYLNKHGWYRMDARGNKTGIDAQFCPPVEKLAFELLVEGEVNLPDIYAEPLPVVVDALTQFDTVEQVAENLPDLALSDFN